MMGEVGEAGRQGETKQEVAKINAQTAVLATERKAEKALADSKLKSREIEIEQNLNLQRIQAQRAAEHKDAELKKGVEQKNAEMELERLRATKVTAAKIAREAAEQQADANLYTETKSADGIKYAQTAEAEATYFRAAKDADAAMYSQSKDADAAMYRQSKDADAALYRQAKDAQAYLTAKEKEAEAMYFIKEHEALAKERTAEADYIARQKEAAGLMEMSKAYGALSEVLGGPSGLMQYMMLQNGTYQELANANARAIHGLQPKIDVWNTGSQDGSADPTAPIRNLFQCLPPMLSTIADQTGMGPPSWLAQMAKDGGANNKQLAPKDQRQDSAVNPMWNGKGQQ
jgi:flotillin